LRADRATLPIIWVGNLQSAKVPSEVGANLIATHTACRGMPRGTLTGGQHHPRLSLSRSSLSHQWHLCNRDQRRGPGGRVLQRCQQHRAWLHLRRGGYGSGAADGLNAAGFDIDVSEQQLLTAPQYA